MEDRCQEAIKALQLKVTPKRVAILRMLTEESIYLSPEEIWKKVRKDFRNIGLPSVYRILEEFSRGGLVLKVIHTNRQLYYYLCPNPEHHHHFICLSCRKVQDLNICIGEEAVRRAEKKTKGKVLSHILQINGLCEKCSGGKETEA
jgi:Fe2+ or Zn2+ uptake regulation protein